MSSTDLATVARFLGLAPDDVRTTTALILADRYGLDVVAGDLVVLEGRPPAVTLSGLRRLAMRSGRLDGVELTDARQDDTGTWRAEVAVHVKGCSHPFTFDGLADPDTVRRDGRRVPNPHARALAIARAERRALRAAFPLTADLPDPDERTDP